MKANERIYVRSYVAYTTEDVFNQDETGRTCVAWTSGDNPVKGRFAAIEDALKAVCAANYFGYRAANWYNFGRDMPDETGRFDFSVMVDADNSEATPSDIELWKAGRKRLWSCCLTVHLGVCAERELTQEEVAA